MLSSVEGNICLMSLFLGPFLGMDSSGGRKKPQKELKASSGCVFFSCGVVELVARCWWNLLQGVGGACEVLGCWWSSLQGVGVVFLPRVFRAALPRSRDVVHRCWRDSAILVSPGQFLPEVPLLGAGSTLVSGSRVVLLGEKASFPLRVTVPSLGFSPLGPGCLPAR